MPSGHQRGTGYTQSGRAQEIRQPVGRENRTCRTTGNDYGATTEPPAPAFDAKRDAAKTQGAEHEGRGASPLQCAIPLHGRRTRHSAAPTHKRLAAPLPNRQARPQEHDRAALATNTIPRGRSCEGGYSSSAWWQARRPLSSISPIRSCSLHPKTEAPLRSRPRHPHRLSRHSLRPRYRRQPLSRHQNLLPCRCCSPTAAGSCTAQAAPW